MNLRAADGEFSAYGLSHWLVLVVFALGAVAFVAIGRGHRDTPAARRFSRSFGAVLLTVHLSVQVFSMTLSDWGIEHSIPLHLSDLAGFVAAYALWSRRHWVFSLAYYWCLTLSAQALIFPVLTSPDFPHREFIAFWGMHLLVVWAAIYLTWGLGMRPDWRSYRVAVTITACWAAAAMIFNAVVGTNYGFLNRKPETTSLLDVLGPWPWYLIPEVALVLLVWALMTWPWVRRSGPARERAREF
ncbi:YwaF family protein [Qaidamihabitans albus]|uniref:YwaF family protein n=1 Tax=Qaidamihabitans albus TaxID=2795733 RepID=UPI0018F1B98D|nr:TIGR02206 family membrane protein [Qaidamihabitans albus]